MEQQSELTTLRRELGNYCSDLDCVGKTQKPGVINNMKKCCKKMAEVLGKKGQYFVDDPEVVDVLRSMTKAHYEISKLPYRTGDLDEIDDTMTTIQQKQQFHDLKNDIKQQKRFEN